MSIAFLDKRIEMMAVGITGRSNDKDNLVSNAWTEGVEISDWKVSVYS
jgi:hypothetical protein